MITVETIGVCIISVNWTLPESPPHTAAPAYVVIEVKLSNLDQWTEVGQYTIRSELKTGTVVGRINVTNSESELNVRGRCGNDTSNIGVGDYYTENTTYTVYSEGTLKPFIIVYTIIMILLLINKTVAILLEVTRGQWL